MGIGFPLLIEPAYALGGPIAVQLFLAAVAALAFTLAVLATVSNVLYGGLTPYAAAMPGQTPTGAASVLEHLERLPRLAALWIDRDHGLLRSAPFAALAFLGAFALWRSHADRLARALPGRRDAEAAAALALVIRTAAVALAAFAAPTMSRPWFPGRHLVAGLPAAAWPAA